MSYNQSAPLLRHQLDSILPYQIKPYQSKPILKTKQFYKPQQFIWNNPHRTSDTIYKFYHKYNQNYQKNKAPTIQKLQRTQKQQRDINRIKKLTQIRQQTRQKFFTKQKDRETLQGLSGTREKTQNDDYYGATAVKRFSTVSHYHSKPSKYEPMIPSYLPSKIPIRKSDSLLKNIQQTYLTGVKKCDVKRKVIENMILSQTHRHQNDLRDDFQRQKELNSKRMSQVSRIEVSKLDIKSLYKEV